MAGYGTDLYGTALYGGGSLSPLKKSDLKVHLFLGNQWRDATSYVRQEAGVSYTRGYSPDSTSLAPGSASLTFDNSTGQFSPRKVGSLVYGVRNTPLRIGFGKAPIGRGTKTLVNASTSVLAGGPTDSTGVASTQICLFAIGTVTSLTAPAGMTERNEGTGVSAEFSVNDVADADGNLGNQTATAGATVTSYGNINVGLAGTWTYRGANLPVTGPASLSVDTVDGNWVFVGQAWSSDPRGAMVPPTVYGKYAPEWTLVADSGVSSGPRSQGYIAYFPTGTYTVKIASDLISGDTYGCFYHSLDAPAWAPRFTGVVREWPVEWDKSDALVDTPVSVSGGLYQGRQDSDVRSPARVILNGNGTHYWPMEDSGGGFSGAYAATPRMTATTTGGTDTAPVYASYTGAVGSAPLATFLDAGAQATFDPIAVGTTGIECNLMVGIPSGMGAGANIAYMELVGGSVNTIGVEYTSNTQLTLKITYNDGTATSTVAMTTGAGSLPVGGVDNKLIGLAFSMAQSGADIIYGTAVRDLTWSNGWQSTTAGVGVAGTVVTKTAGSVKGVKIGLEVGTGATVITTATAIGHVVIGPSPLVDTVLSSYAAVGGSQFGLQSWARFAAAPVPVAGFVTTESSTELDQGPLITGSAADRLQTAVDTTQALAFDAAGFVGVNYLDRSLSESAVTAIDWTYSNKQLADPLTPVDDDQSVMNRVRVTRPGGWGEALYEATAGTLGTDAVGPYSREVEAFPNTVSQAADLAEWIVNQGTVDTQRWPQITVEWAASGNSANYNLPNLNIGRWMSLLSLPTFVGPDVKVQIVGIRETVDTARIRTTYITRPAEGWQVLVLDDSTFGVIYNNTTATANRIGL